MPVLQCKSHHLILVLQCKSHLLMLVLQCKSHLLMLVLQYIFIRYKTRNHPQTIQTTYKPVKYRTNHPQISQKLHSFFPGDIFYEPQLFLCSSHARREMRAFFWCSCYISHFVFAIAQFFTVLNCRLQS